MPKNMILCPNCKNIAYWNSYFQRYRCSHCNWEGEYQIHDKCDIEMEREVNETLWYSIMRYKDSVFGTNPDYTYQNDTFMCRSYNWNAEFEDEVNQEELEKSNGLFGHHNDFHFWHKPSGLKIYFYKYPLRSAEANMEITHEQFYAVLHDCKNSLEDEKGKGNIRFYTEIDKWWEKK